MKITISTLAGEDANFGTWLQLISLYRYLEEEFGAESSIWWTPKIRTWRKCINIFERDFEYFGFRVRPPEDSDFIVIGSDAVLWFDADWYDKHQFFEKYVLFPGIDDSKKIIFAGSAPDKTIRGYKYYDMLLKNIKYLSFREKTTYQKNIFPEHPNWTYVFDPTFLHDPEYYLKFAKRPDMELPDGFTVSYFPHKNEWNCGLKVPDNAIELYDNPNIGIREFLWMMSNCDMLYTNAFHGTVFGIMFGKKIVNDRCSMDKTKCVLDEFQAHVDENHVISYDMDTVRKAIVKQRERSRHFLECAFSNKDLSFREKRFACYANNSTLRNLSTSGGFCGVAAAHILDKNAVVYGAAYIDGFRHVKTVRVNNISDYFKLVSKSKYSYCQDCDFNMVKQDLDNKIHVLFIGCPCQVKRLKSFLQKEYENLITIDLLCYGCSEPKYLEEFISQIEMENGASVVSIDMRKHHKYVCTAMFSNGKWADFNNVFSTFVNQNNLMPICRECNMHKGNNVSDITVGDFWGYKKDVHSDEFNPQNGTNIVNVHTQKGQDFVDSLKPDLNVLYNV